MRRRRRASARALPTPAKWHAWGRRACSSCRFESCDEPFVDSQSSEPHCDHAAHPGIFASIIRLGEYVGHAGCPLMFWKNATPDHWPGARRGSDSARAGGGDEPCYGAYGGVPPPYYGVVHGPLQARRGRWRLEVAPESHALAALSGAGGARDAVSMESRPHGFWRFSEWKTSRIEITK